MTTKTPTLLGGAMIIAGTIIGAGMLANMVFHARLGADDIGSQHPLPRGRKF